jgi:hypothetical protein
VPSGLREGFWQGRSCARALTVSVLFLGVGALSAGGCRQEGGAASSRRGGGRAVQADVRDAGVVALFPISGNVAADAGNDAQPFLSVSISQPNCTDFAPGYSASKAKKIWTDRGCICPVGVSDCECVYRIVRQRGSGCVVQSCFPHGLSTGIAYVDKRGGGHIVGGGLFDSSCDKLGPGWDAEFSLGDGGTASVCGQTINCE